MCSLAAVFFSSGRKRSVRGWKSLFPGSTTCPTEVAVLVAADLFFWECEIIERKEQVASRNR